MATFGKTDDGSNQNNITADRLAVSSAVPASSGTLTKLTARIWVTSTSTVIKGVIYSDSADPSTLLAVSDEVTVSNTAVGDIDLPFSGVNQIPIVSGVTYWIGWHVQDPGATNFSYKRDATANALKRSTAVYASGAPSSFGTPTDDAGKLAVYATYTEQTIPITAVQTYDGSYVTTHTVTAVDTSGTNPYTIGFSFNKNPTAEVSGATVDSNAATLADTNENANVCAIQTWAEPPTDGSSVWEFSTPTSKELSAIVLGLTGVDSTTPYNTTIGTAGTYGTDARVTITGTAGSLFLVSVVAQGDKTFTAVGCVEHTELTAASGIGGAFFGYVTATGASQTIGADLSAADNYRISVIEILKSSGATTTSTSSTSSSTSTSSTSTSLSTSTSSTSTSQSTSTSSTSTSQSTSTSSTSTSLSTSTSTSTSSTSTSLSTSTSSTSTSQSTSTSTSTTQSMTTSTSSTSTSTSTSSTSSSTSQSTSTSTTQSFTTSTSSTSSSSSTSSTSTSQSTSTSSTSTSQSTSTSSTSRSTSTSSTSSSTSTSISTSTSSTSVSTSTSTSTSSTSLSTSTSFSTSTSTSSTSSSTSSTSSSTSSTTTLPPDSRVIPTLKMPLKDLFIKHKMSR